ARPWSPEATPPPACWSRCRTRPPAPSSGSTRPPACTTTTHGGSAGSAWPAPSRAQPTAGIGNIYADESLHHARIHPARPAGALTLAEARRLHTAVQAVLRRAIETGGTSIAAGQVTSTTRRDFGARASPAAGAAP